MTTDDDRIAYLVDRDPGGLDAEDREELDDLAAILADPAMWSWPNPALEDAVVGAIGAVAGTPTADVSPARETPSPSPFGPRRPTGRPRLALLGAAAALLLLAGVGATRLLGADQRGPDEINVALSGTELYPGEGGEATLRRFDSGWEIRLDAAGLPRLDQGRFYQAWLRSDTGVLVPVGTFNEGRDVVLWAGVAPTQFPTITVTIEEADGNQESSGQRVLAGRVGAT